MHQPGRPVEWPAAAAGTAVVVGLVAVVGIASRSSAFTRSKGAGAGHFPTAEVEVLGLVVATAFLAAIVLGALALLRLEAGRRAGAGRPSYLGAVLFLALAVAVLLLGSHHLHPLRHLLHLAAAPPRPEHLRASQAGKARFEWAPVVGFAVALASAALLLLYWRWRRRPAGAARSS
ncbi:MAG: hypothetical protein ACRD0L_09225, partial [Acidimicrobiales bacterium]